MVERHAQHSRIYSIQMACTVRRGRETGATSTLTPWSKEQLQRCRIPTANCGTARTGDQERACVRLWVNTKHGHAISRRLGRKEKAVVEFRCQCLDQRPRSWQQAFLEQPSNLMTGWTDNLCYDAGTLRFKGSLLCHFYERIYLRGPLGAEVAFVFVALSAQSIISHSLSKYFKVSNGCLLLQRVLHVGWSYELRDVMYALQLGGGPYQCKSFEGVLSLVRSAGD
ncbi:hypothetical protein DL96DRAFT_887598 [Flagelloscypha sp. PMI_526]|nr:hypothetical protein DL96DRAFT_887598 [Flagelloscypha sp. PMI_526]